MWVDPELRIPPGHEPDPDLLKWFLAFGARAVTEFDFPLFTTLTGYPHGANVIANASILGLGIPFTPITLLFGADVSFVALMTLGLAGSAAGWYLVLRRHAACSTLAAAIGGGLCGFSPAMVSHALGHLHLTAAFVLPFIILFALALREGNEIVNGLVLGLLVAWQVFIGAEMLLLCALGLGAFVTTYALLHRQQARALAMRYVRGLSIASGVAILLLAFPLWFWFYGPQSYRGLGIGAHNFGADLGSFLRLPTQSPLGERSGNAAFAQNFAEENTFFGWPLLIAALLSLAALRKVKLAWTLAIVGAGFALLSLGATITLKGRPVATGPWKFISELPLFDSVIPSRFGFIVAVVIAAMVAMGFDRLRAERQLEGVAVIALAVLTVMPTALPGGPQNPVPQFITSEAWREYVSAGQTLVPVPPPSPEHPESLRWAAAAGIGFAMPKGYFLRPQDNQRGAAGTFWSKERFVAELATKVQRTGEVPALTAEHRDQAVSDVRYWNSAILVLPQRAARSTELHQAITELYGQPVAVQDVWLWDVRRFIASTTVQDQ